MAHLKKFELQDSTKNLVIDYNRGDLSIDTQLAGGVHMADFILSLGQFTDKTRPVELRVDRTGVSQWNYSFESIDKRHWRQTVDFSTSRVLMNFDVKDYWALEEFVPHRVIREHIIGMIRFFELERLACDFKTDV